MRQYGTTTAAVFSPLPRSLLSRRCRAGPATGRSSLFRLMASPKRVHVAPMGGDFGQLEYDAWGDEGVTVAYDGGFGPLTAQATGPMLDAALTGKEVGDGPARILDVATGPGYVAARAASRGHRVVGLDWSESFLGSVDSPKAKPRPFRVHKTLFPPRIISLPHRQKQT
jgi:SAM-dependent methyltransferase